MKDIQVRMEDGMIAVCTVIERMGFNHDVGAKTAWVSFGNKEFMAVCQGGRWRKWSAKDRAQPIIEWAEREAQRRR